MKGPLPLSPEHYPSETVIARNVLIPPPILLQDSELRDSAKEFTIRVATNAQLRSKAEISTDPTSRSCDANDSDMDFDGIEFQLDIQARARYLASFDHRRHSTEDES